MVKNMKTKASLSSSMTASSSKVEMECWISSLAKKATSLEATRSRNVDDNNDKLGAVVKLLSKEERKQKRAAKLELRRQERLRTKMLKQQQHPSRSRSRTNHDRGRPKSAAVNDPSKGLIDYLAMIWRTLEKRYQNDRRPYLPSPENENNKKKRTLNEGSIQPRKSDYSGMGLARDSLYLSFEDPSHVAKLEQEFQEHIPGFFGRQRTKAMKRQLDGNMLWRQLVDQKKQNKKTILPKKIAKLNPDERVQAMMDAGMI